MRAPVNPEEQLSMYPLTFFRIIGYYRVTEAFGPDSRPGLVRVSKNKGGMS